MPNRGKKTLSKTAYPVHQQDVNMAINFPSATSVGETYTDPTSGSTFVCVALGPPAQWVGSGSSTSLDNTYLRKDGSNDPVTGQLEITPATDTTGLVVTQPSGNTAAAMRITNEGSGDSLVIEDSASPDSRPIVADSFGRLLVGTTTGRANFFNNSLLTSFLQVEGITHNASSLSLVRNETVGSTQYGPYLVLGSSPGPTNGSNTLTLSNAIFGAISFQGTDGTEFVEGARIEAYVDGTPGADDMPGRLTFQTTAAGGSLPTERMRIDSSGNVLIGGTLPSSPNITLSAAGNITAETISGAAFRTAIQDFNTTSTTPVTLNYTVPSFGMVLLVVGSAASPTIVQSPGIYLIFKETNASVVTISASGSLSSVTCNSSGNITLTPNTSAFRAFDTAVIRLH